MKKTRKYIAVVLQGELADKAIQRHEQFGLGYASMLKEGIELYFAKLQVKS